MSATQTANLTDVAGVAALLGNWWFAYDAGDFHALSALLSEDARFTCRTDTGATDFEEFVRCDIRGRDDIITWQANHRADSPYPLRHHSNNLHLTERRGDQQDFASYILVTQVSNLLPVSVSSGICSGTARSTPDGLRLSSLHLLLDTMTSVPFRERPALD